MEDRLGNAGVFHLATIFVVDDDPEAIFLYKDLMADNPEHQIIAAASNGAEAVRMYGEMIVKPDIIIMDYLMPEMNGLEAMKDILADNPEQCMVFVTGDLEAARRAVKEGAVGFLLKPFRIDALFNALRAVESEMKEKRLTVRETMLGIAASMNRGAGGREAFRRLDREILERYINKEDKGAWDAEQALIRFVAFANDLGARITLRGAGDDVYEIKNTICPWETTMEFPNPVFCQMCRGMLSLLAEHTGRKYELNTLGTILNRDATCEFRISFYDGPED